MAGGAARCIQGGPVSSRCVPGIAPTRSQRRNTDSHDGHGQQAPPEKCTMELGHVAADHRQARTLPMCGTDAARTKHWIEQTTSAMHLDSTGHEEV
jgi:hypothetical protein